MLERPRAQDLWVRSLSTTHEQLLRVLNDDLTNVQTEGGVVVLNLRPLVVQLGDQVAIVGRVAERLPADAGRIEVMDATQLETAQDITGLLDTLGRFIWFIPLGLAALAIWLAGDRRRSIVRSLAIGAIIAGTLVLVARSVAGNYVVDNLVQADSVRPAASDAWEILTALLRDGARTLVGVGIVLLIGVWLVGPSRRAVAVRARLAPWLERPEIAYGAAALALVLLVWWGPTEQTRRWQVILLFAVLLGLGVAALARAAKRDEDAGGALPAAPGTNGPLLHPARTPSHPTGKARPDRVRRESDPRRRCRARRPSRSGSSRRPPTVARPGSARPGAGLDLRWVEATTVVLDAEQRGRRHRWRARSRPPPPVPHASPRSGALRGSRNRRLSSTCPE